MSTKTSIKRIALVAVAALGLGMVSTVSARAAFAAGAVTQGSATIDNAITTYAGRVGQQVSITITGDVAANDVTNPAQPALSVAAAITSQPGSTIYPTLTGNATGFDNLTFQTAGLVFDDVDGDNTSTGSATTVATINYAGDTTEDVTATADQTLATLTFTPNAIGTYTINVWNEKDRTITDYAATNTSATSQAALSGSESFKTFTVIVSAGVGSITLTSLASTTAMYEAGANGQNGSLIKVALKDAAGNAAALTSGESVTITPTLSGDIAAVNGSTVASAEGVAYNLSSANFNAQGIAWINVIDDTAETSTFTASLNNGLSTSTTVKFVDTTPVAAVPTTASTSGFAFATPNYTVAAGANTFTFKATVAADAYASFTVTEELISGVGSITGYTTALTYEVAALSDAAAYASVTATSTANSQTMYKVSTDANGNAASGTEAIMASAARSAGTLTATPAVVNAVVGSTTTLTVRLKDNFGVGYASQTITAAVTGKNPTVVSLSAVTDANGYATFNITDANTNSLTSDTVTFTGGSGATSTISYGTNAVSTFTGTYTGSTDLIAGTTTTDIDASATGATGAYATLTVTAKNASGALLAGVPVKFAVAGLTGAEVLTTYATVYTGTDGKATTRVSSYAAGKATITATAGDKTVSGDVYFKQATATEARTISAVASTGGVTATVKDRYGNAIAGVYVYATRSGSAYFGNGVSSTSGVTDKNGTVDFVVNGSGTVTLQLGSSSAADATYGQSYAAAGYDADAVNGTEITAYVAGTSIANQKGLGGSLAAAGVNSVSVEVTGNSTAADSIDAANEATDAANAATDAANAAAEAADAATAAAQDAQAAAMDAQAAVAALATSVSALIAGIKAQITTLTNLVIKIQKKVKA